MSGGEPYQSCAVSREEFTTDGLEQGRSRQAVTNKNIYWKNGRDMLKLVQIQKEEKAEEIQEEEKYLSAGEMLAWQNNYSQIQKNVINYRQNNMTND